MNSTHLAGAQAAGRAALKQCRVLVTPTSFGRGDADLRPTLEAAVGQVLYSPHSRPLTAAELAELLPGCDGYIAGLDDVSAAALAAADRLRVIARYGAGVDRIDLAAAAARGIVVTNTPAANAAAVAELTIGLLVALARRIPALDRETRAGGWPRASGAALEGKTIGLVGFGAIGRRVARRLQGWECTLLAYDPAVTAGDPEAAALGVRLLPLVALLAAGDFISLHAPAAPSTRGLVDAAFLAAMRPGAYLINTARGELVDEAALAAALHSGRLAGAALDAFAHEPPGLDHPLFALPNVIATPHIGAHTDGAARAMGWGSVRDLLAVLAGKMPSHRVI